MKPLGINHLSVLLAGTLLLCHGVFGALHLVCDTPRCADEHAAEHRPAQAVSAAAANEHLVGHDTGTEYFAVVAGLLGLLFARTR